MHIERNSDLRDLRIKLRTYKLCIYMYVLYKNSKTYVYNICS